MKDSTVNLLLTFGVIAGIIYIVAEGRRLLDLGIGDDPGGIVGGDDPYADPESPEYPGWLTRWEMYLSGNPDVGVYGTVPGSIWDWSPFEGHWGFFS